MLKYLAIIGCIIILISCISMFLIWQVMDNEKYKKKLIESSVLAFIIGMCMLGIAIIPFMMLFIEDLFEDLF